MTKRNAVAREVLGFAECKQAGDFYFIRYGDDPVPIGIFHACPCGCGAMGSLYFRGRRPKDWGAGAEWDISGEWPKATLAPSIGFKGNHDSPKGSDGYHWHGYLRAGIFEEC